MTDYKAIAQGAGFEVHPVEKEPGKYFWFKWLVFGNTKHFDTEDDAWRGCCVTNNLVTLAEIHTSD